MKQCGSCEQVKPLMDFYLHKREGNSPYRLCKPCHNQRTRKWQEKNPKNVRESRWASRGIRMTIEQYETLYQSQEGCCKICGRAEPVSGRRLAVDHDHSTGEIRGLLCTKCNTTVGWVEQNPTLLNYLKGEL